MYKPYVVVVLDGYGIAPKNEGNAVYLAKKPFLNQIKKNFPYTELWAHGEFVGLEEDQMSGSEVGHINIGSGRVIAQESVLINKAINDGSFYENQAFKAIIRHIKKNKSALHLIGLMSNDDSPHSHFSHFKSLVFLAKKNQVQKLFVHLFTDGRDSDPKSALSFLKKWTQVLKEYQIGKIATIIGRFYAMDRTKNWELLKQAYACMVKSKGNLTNNIYDLVNKYYQKGIGDEYLPASVFVENKKPVSRICDNDGIIFFNLRSDRARQLTKLFVLKESTELELPFPRLKNLKVVSLTGFGPNLDIIPAFNPAIIENTLPQSLKNFKQLYITETEKFSHITYFLNGRRSYAVNNEVRIMVPSPRVLSYADTPEMSAGLITDIVVQYLKKREFDFVFINFANPDMLGHTGNLKATIQAIGYLDKCLLKIYKEIIKNKGVMFVLSDHGNAEVMIDMQTKKMFTSHTKNKVPLIITSKKIKNLIEGGKLANFCPTLLKLMQQTIPDIMEAPLF